MTQMQRYNYKTKEYEAVSSIETDEQAMCYIPNDRATQSLYRLYRDHKEMSIFDAMEKLLKIHVGIKDEPKNLFERVLDWFKGLFK